MKESTLSLTKTDFIHYLRCPKSFWLSKRKPDLFPKGEVSAFLLQIAREGYEVEAYAQQLFAGGVSLPTGARAKEETERALAQEVPVLFQPTFQTTSHLFVRADILERHSDGTYSLYEVKSSTSIKESAAHDQVKDACFQMIALKECGLSIRDVYIIHVNKEYVFRGTIVPEQLLKRVRITEKVLQYEEALHAEITCALSLLSCERIDETGCPCYRKTRSHHCDAFTYFNGALPRHSVWELCGIREKKLTQLLERGVTTLAFVPEDIPLNDRQERQVQAARLRAPVVNIPHIRASLAALTFPLYFFDYETAVSAVPKVVGTRPWQHIPFQFSLHILSAEGVLRHVEYIAESLSDSESVIASLVEHAGSDGSFISWHASFEVQRNREMAEHYPVYRTALEGINGRMYDLEVLVKEAYSDAAFCGSSSIKRVLPVLCPHLSYETLAVHDGTEAMEQWFTFAASTDPVERERIRSALSEYCTLDTYAMVELYRTLLACSA